jgi:anti-sigma-K factor RskA
MKSKGEYDSALAAEYALGTLRGPARLNFEQRIQREATLAALVARWQVLLAPLDLALTPITPPEHVWKKIRLSLPVQAAPRRKRWDYLGWALAAGLASLLLVPRFITQPPDFAPAVVLNAGQQGSGQWIVSMGSDKRHLRLTPLNPQMLAAANSLQLWAIPPGEKPRSLGLVAAQRPTELALNSMTLTQGMTIAISLEPAGGSPTGLPTGPVLYSGELTSL